MATHNLAFETQLLQQLNTFWIALGVADEPLRHQLTQRCLTHVAFVLAEVTPAKAIRIVLNQAQHFFDQALATYMGLDAIQDRNQLTAFRAQLLHQKIHTDFLFTTDAMDSLSWKAKHEAAIPPESPLAMPPQTVSFAFKANTTIIENKT